MLGFISHPSNLRHEMGDSHPEQPARVAVIEDEIKNRLSNVLKFYSPVMITKDLLLQVHDENYINYIYQIAPKDQNLFPIDPDTFMNAFTLEAALYAAGAVILGVDLVMRKEVQSVFCNIRPPGHHAEKSKAMGFCFFNNIAIGAAYALSHYHLKKVAIVDFDVHHGNGTENIFQDNPNVLFCSSFQSPFYPFSGEGTQSEHILNIPLASGTGSKVFREKVTEHWLAKLKSFKPELIFISAGFDAYIEDDMSEISLTEKDYAWITEEVKNIADEVCEGRIVSALEGGYHLNGLRKCALAHVEALLGH